MFLLLSNKVLPIIFSGSGTPETDLLVLPLSDIYVLFPVKLVFWFMRHRSFTLLIFTQVKLSITSGICDTEALIDVFRN